MHGISNGDSYHYKQAESATSQVIPPTPVEEMVAACPVVPPSPSARPLDALSAPGSEYLLSKSEEEENFPEDCHISFCQSGICVACKSRASSIFQDDMDAPAKGNKKLKKKKVSTRRATTLN